MFTENIAAVLESPGRALKPLPPRPIPTPSEGEILIRNHAIAANPADWKIRDFGGIIDVYPTVLGSDVCGTITAVGPKGTKFKVGDRIAGFALKLRLWEYRILSRFEDGATFLMAFATAAVAYFERMGILRPVVVGREEVSQQGPGMLVWGASSSTGTATVQLATNLGFKVFATASPQNHDYVKSLGAYAVVDYRDPDVVSKLIRLAKEANTPLQHGFDFISEGKSSILSAKTLLQSGGQGNNKLVLSGPWPTSHEKPDGVDISMTIAAFAFVDHVDMGSWMFNEYLPQAVEEKRIVPAPKVVIVDGGVAAAQKALGTVKAGVSATKIVVKVD
ncbi:zinc binding dehydrogenase, putative [Talaromyces stipitatus ATCC 10500]|uniref:Zinc binding dehydrogenase, putative n=1 Tax=Talaromyces stipitatus (strain ATCC 10500 / CBS 375.48 / QM 6759 / NRRL 1006) TaxID=441959 RepID=B8LTE2_TALSN|nr:zinc binding dehydrogenase, putative [Talaromyces stipitatus ATCC 10500]EED23020.1 zinc binding dehydrogenase, putative [Talaromyces stipitatus ATCC 10500]